MSNIPAELKYSASHEWIKEEDGIFVIGLTDYAQSALGDIVFINLPEEGDEVTAGESFADVESVKAVSDVLGLLQLSRRYYCPRLQRWRRLGLLIL